MKATNKTITVTCPTCEGVEMIDFNPNHDRCPDCNGSGVQDIKGFLVSFERIIEPENKPQAGENQDLILSYYIPLTMLNADLELREVEHDAMVWAFNDYMDNFNQYLVKSVKVSPRYY